MIPNHWVSRICHTLALKDMWSFITILWERAPWFQIPGLILGRPREFWRVQISVKISTKIHQNVSDALMGVCALHDDMWATSQLSGDFPTQWAVAMRYLLESWSHSVSSSYETPPGVMSRLQRFSHCPLCSQARAQCSYLKHSAQQRQ